MVYKLDKQRYTFESCVVNPKSKPYKEEYRSCLEFTCLESPTSLKYVDFSSFEKLRRLEIRQNIESDPIYF
jgi:heme oxygenase